MTKVKICGITNIGDAKKAVEYGADLLGFIFAKSPRQVNIEVVNKISNLYQEIKRVGVFANQPIAEVKKIVTDCKLDYLQLHGDESPEYCQEFNLPIIKAFRVKDKSYLNKLKNYNINKYLSS